MCDSSVNERGPAATLIERRRGGTVDSKVKDIWVGVLSASLTVDSYPTALAVVNLFCCVWVVCCLS